jgi:hypothetical protein
MPRKVTVETSVAFFTNYFCHKKNPFHLSEVFQCNYMCESLRIAIAGLLKFFHLCFKNNAVHG